MFDKVQPLFEAKGVDKLPLSLVIITNAEKYGAANNELNISRLIRSVPFASDILVLDSSAQLDGGPNRVTETARRLGARVLNEVWRGLAKQKIRATALARNERVLSLEIDEALSPEAQTEIYDLFKNKKWNADAYELPRRTYFLSRLLKYYDGGLDRQTRLIDRGHAKWVETADGATIEAANISKLDSAILHWPFENIDSQIETVKGLSGVVLQNLLRRGEKFTGRKMAVDVVTTFLRSYVVKKGYLDGAEGLLMSFATAAACAFGWAKLYENSHLGSNGKVQTFR